MQTAEGVEVDVIFGDAAWVNEALEKTNQDVEGYPVLDLPYLVLMKMAASRTQDLSDVARMLGLADEADLERVREVLRRYTPEDMEDLESLIYLGKLEAGSPPRL